MGPPVRFLDQTGRSGARGDRMGGPELQDHAGGGHEDGHPGGHEADLPVQSQPRPQGSTQLSAKL